MTQPQRPSSGPGRGLSLDRIVTAALEVIDENGVAVASMRSVGDRLGVRAMSLYRYVANREQLLDRVVERIVDELGSDPDVPERPTAGWRDYVERLAWGVRRFARAHPRAFPLVATRPARAPWVNPPLRSVRWVERLLSALRDEGFDDEQVLLAYRAFTGFLLGHLLLETSAMALRDPEPGDVDPQRYPVTHRLRAGLSRQHGAQEFGAGLAEVLDRIERLGTGAAGGRSAAG